MNTVIATVTAVDRMDDGARSGVTLLTEDGRNIYLITDNTASTLLDATMKGAMSHGDSLRIGFEPLAPRLGAPVGRIVRATVMDYQTEIGHAA